jgi:hypothetical protein
MKLWLLRADYHLIVVRAETEDVARQMVKKDDEREIGGDYVADSYLDASKYTCTEITVEGDAEIIDQHSG